MNHQRLKEALQALHDGELGETDRAEASAHLAGCADCRQAYERWRRLAKAFFRAPAPPTPFQTESFVRGVMERLEPAEVPFWERISAPLLIPALSFGLAGLLLSIAWPRAESIAPLDVLMLTDVQSPLTSSLLLPPAPGKADTLFSYGSEEL